MKEKVFMSSFTFRGEPWEDEQRGNITVTRVEDGCATFKVAGPIREKIMGRCMEVSTLYCVSLRVYQSHNGLIMEMQPFLDQGDENHPIRQAAMLSIAMYCRVHGIVLPERPKEVKWRAMTVLHGESSEPNFMSHDFHTRRDAIMCKHRIKDLVEAPLWIGYAKVYAVVICYCGTEVECDAYTNSCDCGRDYSFNGTLLAPRSQWGEETGETGQEIMQGECCQ